MSPAVATSPSPVLLLVSAPSGAGKTTICQGLLAARPTLTRAVTCTTRTPRTGEVPGRDYYFLTSEEFTQRVEAGEFLEHAGVYGNRYGTLRSEVHRRLGAGLDVLLNIDVQGAASVRAQAARDPVIQRALVTVFVVTPTVAELERRLRSRGTDSEDVVQRRLAAARSEMDEARHFDYLLISGTVEEDRQRMEAIYLAEKLRFDRVPLPGC